MSHSGELADLFVREVFDYNKKGYTLYIVNISDTEDSKIAASIYHKIEDKYKHTVIEITK